MGGQQAHRFKHRFGGRTVGFAALAAIDVDRAVGQRGGGGEELQHLPGFFQG
ncbi:hypothetical protein D3C85_1844140 [compost metagenome]